MIKKQTGEVSRYPLTHYEFDKEHDDETHALLRDRIDSLRRQRDESTGSLRKETKTVEVMIDAAREGNLTLNLATVISRVGWVPAYDFRLAADAGTVELTFRAMVRQQTGEDWNNVDLTLSTARPATGAAPPELNPWHISFPRLQPLLEQSLVMTARPAPAGMMSKRALVLDRSAPAEEAPAAVETAQINEEQASVSFHIPRPLDIPILYSVLERSLHLSRSALGSLLKDEQKFRICLLKRERPNGRSL